MNRDVLARAALAEIPKILTLLDRNPHSPTYGCFDRNFWHYRTIDFASGMSQELVWPLALAHETDAPRNPYYQRSQLKEWVRAGILFAAKSGRRDGSCDDYFPYERASGAAAFSLLACIESYRLLKLDDASMLAFFRRRAGWLAHHDESGRLSNHQALIVLCLELAGQLLATGEWRNAAGTRLDRLLDWQSSEGWFPEYEGCDPGYLTLTISVLARLNEIRPEKKIELALERAVSLAAEFVHPDGSYGGEYGSRNTYNFFPHGFELAGRLLPRALAINDAVLSALERGCGACFADDHIVGHHAWNYLLAWRDFVPERAWAELGRSRRLWLKEAGLLIDRRDGAELYLALNKGGVFKFFLGGELMTSDTQLSLQVRKGSGERTAVAHLVDDYAIVAGDGEITVSGSLGWAKQTQMTTARLVLLRTVMATFGRFFPGMIRRLLQAILITGKKRAPFTFKRSFVWKDRRWRVRDELRGDFRDVTSAGIACDQTSIYVVMSRTFQAGQLQQWLDLTQQLRALKPGEPLVLERDL